MYKYFFAKYAKWQMKYIHHKMLINLIKQCQFKMKKILIYL